MKKQFILITCFIFLIVLCITAHAATLTWTGEGTDELASNPANWLDSITPKNGDNIVFDGTSPKNCTWDINVSLSSLNITSAYIGKVTPSSTLIIKNITWTGGGADELASNPANWSGNIAPQNGDNVVFNGATNCTWDINITPAFFGLSSGYTGTVTLTSDFTIAGNLNIAGGSLNLNNKNLNIDGYILISISGSLYATSSTITVKGDWKNWGSFSPWTSTVVLAGTNQTIYGNTTFYNLTKVVTTADTLYFEAGSTQTIANSLTLQGVENNLLSLRSAINGQYWYIDPQGARNIAFVDIRDSFNINFVSIVLTNSVNSGNNVNLNFGGSECVCLENTPASVIARRSQSNDEDNCPLIKDVSVVTIMSKYWRQSC